MTTASRENESLTNLSPVRPQSVLLCTPVWGAEYVRVFCELVLRTLLAPGNLPVLASRTECIFLIYTNRDSEALLRASSSFQKLTSLLEVRLHFIEDIKAADKYGMLTACYNDAIRIGAERKQGLVFLNADMIYSSGTFASIAKRIDEGKRCVEVDGFRTKKQGMEAALLPGAGDILDIPSSTLVGLALEHIHSISQSHFWETGADGGVIPFHTYWRAGKWGVVGRLSHLYPLYLYPRNWDDLNSAKTIDWDLIERAGLRPEDIHLVLDSEELFVAELSDEDYVIAPTFPDGGTVAGMREFIAAHCAAHHRDCLKYSSRLQVKPGNRLSWRWAELKAWIWYKAVCEQSVLCTALVWYLGRRAKAQRALDRFIDNLRLSFLALNNHAPIINQPGLLKYLMGRDPRPYQALMQAAPTSLRDQLIDRKLPIPFGRNKLHSIDDEYERICLGENSPVAEAPQSNLVLSRDVFFGTGWRMPGHFPARQIGQDGCASIFVRLPQKRAYRVIVSIAKIPFELGNNLSLDVNGQALAQQDIAITDIWRVSGIIPPSALVDHQGRIKLTIKLTDERRRPSGQCFISRIQIDPFSSVQESILEQHGLSSSLYASFCGLSVEYSKVYDDCSPEAEWNGDEAQLWISSLHEVLSSKTLPSQARQSSGSHDIALAGQIIGYGWGNSGVWGSQAYRWLGGGSSASLFLKLTPGRAYLVKVYIHTCPHEVLGTLRLGINDELSLSRGLKWEHDRYFLWVDVPERLTTQSDGVIELSIGTGAVNFNSKRRGMRQQLRKILQTTPSLPPSVQFTRVAFNRLLVIEHDMIATKAEILALQLQQA